MKKIIIIFLILIIAILIGALIYAVNTNNQTSNTNTVDNSNTNAEPVSNNIDENETITENNTTTNTENVEIINNDDNGEENMKLNITVNNRDLTATLANNASVDALVERLQEGPLTINMSDYADMEKVGSLGFNLPRNDESIRTEAGDIILYQGNSLVIYYDHNNWNFTRLGKIDNISQSELMDILGEGDVTVTISLVD